MIPLYFFQDISPDELRKKLPAHEPRYPFHIGKHAIWSFWVRLQYTSRSTIITWSRHCKKLKLLGNLPECPLILTVGRLTHKQQKGVCGFLLSKYLFNESEFCLNTPYFFNPILKMSCNFSLKLNMANRRHVF